MDRDKQITAPYTLPSSGGIFFNIGTIPNMFEGRKCFSIILILMRDVKFLNISIFVMK
jgi:hypothetical protein